MHYGAERVIFIHSFSIWAWLTTLKIHKTVLTKTVVDILGVHQLNSDITLSLVNVAGPVSSQVDNHCCSHHGMRKVGLDKGKQIALSTRVIYVYHYHQFDVKLYSSHKHHQYFSMAQFSLQRTQIRQLRSHTTYVQGLLYLGRLESTAGFWDHFVFTTLTEKH